MSSMWHMGRHRRVTCKEHYAHAALVEVFIQASPLRAFACSCPRVHDHERRLCMRETKFVVGRQWTASSLGSICGTNSFPVECTTSKRGCGHITPAGCRRRARGDACEVILVAGNRWLVSVRLMSQLSAVQGCVTRSSRPNMWVGWGGARVRSGEERRGGR